MYFLRILYFNNVGKEQFIKIIHVHQSDKINKKLFFQMKHIQYFSTLIVCTLKIKTLKIK